MDKPLRILFVEDSPDDTELLVWELRRGGYQPQYRRVDTAPAMKAALAEQPWDIILADYSMPQFSGTAALELLQETGLDIPFIFVSGTIGEDTAVQAMKNGAQDYIVKGNLGRLIPAVQRELLEAGVHRARLQAEEALRESQERMQHILASSPAVIYSLKVEKEQFIGTWVSENIQEVTGWPVEEALAQNWWEENLHLDDQEQAIAGHRILLQQGKHVQEYRFRRKDGEYLWIQDSTRLIRDSSGKPVEVIGSWSDITERIKAEERAQRQVQKLAALRNIDMAITASLDLRVTLSVLLDHVTSELRVDAADILLLNPRTHHLEFAAGRSFRTTGLQQTRLRLGEGHAGRAALERKMVSIPNLTAAKDQFLRAPLIQAEGFFAYYGVPLIAKGEVKGVMEVFHRSRLEPDPEWLGFLDALAGQAAIAIDNASLFDNLQRTNLELTVAYDATIEGWSRALDLRDKETEGHTQRVTEMTLHLARAMGMKEEEMVHIRRGALLHDMGKMGIPDNILLKPGTLTDEEWVVMRRHPQYAHDMLSPIAYLRPALVIPYAHHEKWDGTGYPRGLKGEAIPLAARIFAVADVWDALRSNRPYRPAWSEEKALAYIQEQAGKHFDPAVVEAFLRSIGRPGR